MRHISNLGSHNWLQAAAQRKLAAILAQSEKMSCSHAGFAGADYDLQDALVESTNKASSKAERHGQSFYDYELAGPVSPTVLC